MRKQTEGCWSGGGWTGWGGWVMDTGEGICYGQRCELCKTDESQSCTPGANNTLYVNNNKKRNNMSFSVGLTRKYMMLMCFIAAVI